MKLCTKCSLLIWENKEPKHECKPKKFIVRYYTTKSMSEIMAVHETKAYSEEEAIQKTRDINYNDVIKILKVETIS